jgi:cobalt/nickel transport system permease protein
MGFAPANGMRARFIEATLASLIAASEYAASAEQMALTGGALQRVDPRVKMAGLFGLVIVVAASRQLLVIASLFAVALLLAIFSQVPLGRLAGWVWIPVLFFTGTIAFPAVFLTPGRPLVALGNVLALGNIAITEQGLRSAAFLVSRAETAATLSALLVLTTPWPWVMKALRTFKCPMILVAILGMTYRYIFVILQTAFEMLESRKSRTVGVLAPQESRRLAASAVGVLLNKSLHLSGEVHLAMQSRGFHGEVYVLRDFRARTVDWCWLAGFAVCSAAALWWGR